MKTLIQVMILKNTYQVKDIVVNWAQAGTS